MADPRGNAPSRLQGLYMDCNHYSNNILYILLYLDSAKDCNSRNERVKLPCLRVEYKTENVQSSLFIRIIVARIMYQGLSKNNYFLLVVRYCIAMLF